MWFAPALPGRALVVNRYGLHNMVMTIISFFRSINLGYFSKF